MVVITGVVGLVPEGSAAKSVAPRLLALLRAEGTAWGMGELA